MWNADSQVPRLGQEKPCKQQGVEDQIQHMEKVLCKMSNIVIGVQHPAHIQDLIKNVLNKNKLQLFLKL